MEDLILNIGDGESAKVGRAMVRYESAWIAIAIQHHLESLRELEIVLATESCILVGAGAGGEFGVVEDELEAHVTDIGGTTISICTVLNWLENGGVICNGAIRHDPPSSRVKGQDLQMSHVEPIIFEMVDKIGLESGDNGLAIKINAQRVKVDIRREVKAFESGGSHMIGVRPLFD
jgi:hypothetical protein